MPVIRISEETWEALKSWAIPLEDKPDDVLRRILRAAEEHRLRAQERRLAPAIVKDRPVGVARASQPVRTRESIYFSAIPEVLYELGGRGRMREEIFPLLEERLKPHLRDVDYQLDPGGQVRWQHAAQAARMKLVYRGVLRRGSPMGVWELSERGIEQMERGLPRAAQG